MRARAGAGWVATAAVLALLAPPATAHHAPEVGVMANGSAVVVKSNATCGPDGTLSSGAGPGIGLPILHQPKFAKYSFQGAVNTALHGTGVATVCGYLYPIGDALPGPGIGAACGTTSSSHGQGVLDGLTGGPYQIRRLAWKASAASFFAVTGELNERMLVGLVSARGVGTQCMDKSGSGSTKSGGAGAFVVDAIVLTDPSQAPPKCSLQEAC